MELLKLEITPYQDSAFSQSAGAPYSVLINPEKYTHKYSVSYNKEQPPGTSGVSTKFNKMAPETVSFELIFDATGAIPNSPANLDTEIQKFMNVVYAYNGNIHSPNYLHLSWGSFQFKGRTTSLDLNYTLFRADGSPLRAKVNINFEEYEDPKTQGLKEGKNSPDLTHIITVKAGDTLPMLCTRIYGTPDYYLEVARVNDIMNFRSLEPGKKLFFPPLNKKQVCQDLL